MESKSEFEDEKIDEVKFLVHENDCEKFYMCNGDFKFEMLCPKIHDGKRLHFNQNLNVCDWPQAVKCH
ncbi:hypothetical protein PVAND_015868 [Polypedilum vanderplanki]|uniref:Chitin-binding type-2 domain-containing protein n=1 Tax=Polypedilum vanderplanki TaxID=319348 RepID=A0A9J6BE57_POLVA|nr:hypothetical protein PVAND_015868 [Polypedilum vanderplanki]